VSEWAKGQLQSVQWWLFHLMQVARFWLRVSFGTGIGGLIARYFQRYENWRLSVYVCTSKRPLDAWDVPMTMATNVALTMI